MKLEPSPRPGVPRLLCMTSDEPELFGLAFNEVNRRMDRLTELFMQTDTIADHVPLVTGVNVDASVLSALPLEAEILKPSIEHSITQCMVCEAKIWLGPRQMKVPGGIRICTLCVWVYIDVRRRFTGEEGFPLIPLNPNASQVPRRT